jgi:acyl carrier protein
MITREDVMGIVAAESGLDFAKPRPEAKLRELDISSIDLVSAIFAIEDELNVTIQPEDVSPDATLDDLIDLVLGHAAQ